MIQFLLKRPIQTAAGITFSAPPASVRDVAWSGLPWTDYLIDVNCGVTVSGTFANCRVWMCGGGGGGGMQNSASNYAGTGGGGGYTKDYSGPLTSGSIVIGAGGMGWTSPTEINSTDGGQTSFYMPDTAALLVDGGLRGDHLIGGNGGSGGGASSGTAARRGIGQGTTTRPFADTVNYPQAWCAGGGAGGRYNTSSPTYQRGGAGGSNGGDGSLIVNASPAYGGAGGATGGGNGGLGGTSQAAVTPGDPAATYGSGGGGGGLYVPSWYGREGGNGYRGCVIIRVPKP